MGKGKEEYEHQAPIFITHIYEFFKDHDVSGTNPAFAWRVAAVAWLAKHREGVVGTACAGEGDRGYVVGGVLFSGPYAREVWTATLP